MLIYILTILASSCYLLTSLHRRRQEKSATGAMLRGTRRTALLFGSVLAPFCLLQLWATSFSGLGDPTKTIGQLEQAALKLDRIAARLDMPPLALALAALGIALFAPLFGFRDQRPLRLFGAYTSAASTAATVLALVSSLTFFGDAAAGHLEAGQIRIRQKVKEIENRYQDSYSTFEDLAREEVLRTMADLLQRNGNAELERTQYHLGRIRDLRKEHNRAEDTQSQLVRRAAGQIELAEKIARLSERAESAGRVPEFNRENWSNAEVARLRPSGQERQISRFETFLARVLGTAYSPILESAVKEALASGSTGVLNLLARTIVEGGAAESLKEITIAAAEGAFKGAVLGGTSREGLETIPRRVREIVQGIENSVFIDQNAEGLRILEHRAKRLLYAETAEILLESLTNLQSARAEKLRSAMRRSATLALAATSLPDSSPRTLPDLPEQTGDRTSLLNSLTEVERAYTGDDLVSRTVHRLTEVLIEVEEAGFWGGVRKRYFDEIESGPIPGGQESQYRRMRRVIQTWRARRTSLALQALFRGEDRLLEKADGWDRVFLGQSLRNVDLMVFWSFALLNENRAWQEIERLGRDRARELALRIQAFERWHTSIPIGTAPGGQTKEMLEKQVRELRAEAGGLAEIGLREAFIFFSNAVDPSRVSEARESYEQPEVDRAIGRICPY